jgi:hypothetical protein
VDFAELSGSDQAAPPGRQDQRIPNSGSVGVLFWAQGAQLPSLEAITLGAGYRWVTEERRVGPAVISYRDGKDNPIWAVELDEPDEGADTIGWRPITRPDLPGVDLFDATRVGERDEEGSSS